MILQLEAFGVTLETMEQKYGWENRSQEVFFVIVLSLIVANLEQWAGRITPKDEDLTLMIPLHKQ